MPNASLTAAIKEAYATAPSDVVYLETLEISHPLVSPSIYLVKDRVNHSMTLETAVVKTFVACAFRLTLPASGENGVQELTIAIDNVDRAVSDFIDVVKDSSTAVTLTFRPYLSTDLTVPQMNPPLVLYLSDVTVSTYEVRGRATFADILNKKYPTRLYTRADFPSLAN